ncbi:MAG: hypothetical protein QXK37_05100 [Candidatus Woesearchaeota archaeon]
MARMAKYGKKGQSASSAATLIALIAGFMVLYILFLPPEMRDELLDGGPTEGMPSEEAPAVILNRTVFTETPGRIDFLRFKEYEHPLSAVNLYTTKSAQEQKISDAIYVKNGVFDRLDKNLSFTINDLDNVDNVYLSFKVSKSKGRLIVELNGNSVFEGEIHGTSSPVSIAKSELRDTNRLAFKVSEVGWRFWTTNEYELLDIKLFYDLTDISQQKSRNIFTVSEVEKFNLDTVSIKFFPDCNPTSVGTLDIDINGQSVYSAIPDCGQVNYIEFSPSIIQAGNNRVLFTARKGRYLIDQIVVKTTMKPMIYPVYYFDLDKSLFVTKEEPDDKEECGDIDGVCPSGCDRDIDKDCCLHESSNFWCDVQPQNQDKRCSAVVSETDCNECPSGYEDRNGNPPKVCEDKCGDDTDNYCHPGCNRQYDKDCCFAQSENNFWCDDAPKGGLNACKNSIIREECWLCPSEWKSKESDFSCPEKPKELQDVLKGRYRIKLTLSFINDGERKAGKVFVNGYQFHFDTTGEKFVRYIDQYVESGTNAIKIEPDQTILDIRKLTVEIEG